MTENKIKYLLGIDSGGSDEIKAEAHRFPGDFGFGAYSNSGNTSRSYG